MESYKQNDLCQGICDRADVRLPIIIAGDFNGGPRGSVYKFIKSQNYRCAAEDVLLRRWVTHKSHLGHDVAVDHVRHPFMSLERCPVSLYTTSCRRCSI